LVILNNMCWNAEISLNTFLFACISAIFVYIFGKTRLSIIILILSFSSIQFIEYLTWTYINNKKINRYLSIIGLIIIVIQLILLNYILPTNKNRKIFLLLLFICILLFIIIELKNVNFSMTKGKNGHLIWYWLDVPKIWIILALFFYLLPAYFNKNNNNFYFIFCFITIIISLYFYFKYKTWGSMWCYISNILWLFLIIRILYNSI